MIELAPSILSADFAHLAEQVHPAIEAGATVLHVDVMDGHFVPNLTIGPPVVATLRKAVEVPLDCHLMIENPDEFIPAFIDAGANWISVHQEACVHLHRTLEHIKSHGARAGVVVNPATPVATLEAVLYMVDYVLIMSVDPGFWRTEVYSVFAGKDSPTGDDAGGARTPFPDRGGWRSGIGHDRRRSSCRSGSAGCR